MKLTDYLEERLAVCDNHIRIKRVADSDEFMIKYEMISDTYVGLNDIRNDFMNSQFSNELLPYNVNNMITLKLSSILINNKNLYNAVMTIKKFNDNTFLASIALITQILFDESSNTYYSWYKVDQAT